MSGSYGTLNSKYNTLYALYLKLQNSISTPNLQQVTDISGITTNDMVITDGLKRLDLQKDGVSMVEYSTTKVASFGLNGFSISNPITSITQISANLTAGLNITDTIFSNTMTKSNILLETDASVTNPTPEVYVETLVNDSLSAKVAIAFIKSYVDVSNNYIAKMSLQNDTSNLVATSNSIDISGAVGLAHMDPSYGLVFTKSAVIGKFANDQVFFTNGTVVSTYKRLEMKLVSENYSNTTTQNEIFLDDNGVGINAKLTREKLEFNAEKGLYSIGDNLSIICPDGLDLSLNALSINGDQGDIGEVLISNGAGIAPVWSGIENIICNGSVATPGVSGTVLFSSHSATFSYAPVVILTVVSGDTTTYIANIVAITSTQFTYTISGSGSAFLNFIAI